VSDDEKITIELTREQAGAFRHSLGKHTTWGNEAEAQLIVREQIDKALAAHDRKLAEAELGLPWGVAEDKRCDGYDHWTVTINGKMRECLTEPQARLMASAPDLLKERDAWKAKAEIAIEERAAVFERICGDCGKRISSNSRIYCGETVDHLREERDAWKAAAKAFDERVAIVDGHFDHARTLIAKARAKERGDD